MIAALTAHNADLLARERPRLVRLVYAMLGEVAAAEDVVQEVYVRFSKHEESVRDPAAWLTTVATRAAIDELTSARARRQVYVGPWLPEPIENGGPERADTRVALAEGISFALLVLLESLSPKERAVYVLRALFDVNYSEIAQCLHMAEPAVRQHLHRAEAALRTRKQRFVVDETVHTRMLLAFAQAVMTGELESMTDLLAADATAATDSGGKRSAALRVVTGQQAVSKFVLGLAAKFGRELATRVAKINDTPALVFTGRGGIESVMMLVIDDEERIAQVCFLRNPAKLTHVRADVQPGD